MAEGSGPQTPCAPETPFGSSQRLIPAGLYQRPRFRTHGGGHGPSLSSRIGVRGDPRFREGRRWVRTRNRFRSMTAGSPPLSGLDSTGFRGVRRDRDPDRRPAARPSYRHTRPSYRHTRTCSGYPCGRSTEAAAGDARNKSGHDGGGRPGMTGRGHDGKGSGRRLRTETGYVHAVGLGGRGDDRGPSVSV